MPRLRLRKRTRRACLRHTRLRAREARVARVWANTASTWSAIQAQFTPLAASCSAYEGYPRALSQLAKSALAVQLPGARNGAGDLPGGIGAPAAHAPQPFGED